MRKLNVLQTTVKEVESKWGFSLPRFHTNPLFVRCNATGAVNWDSTLLYSLKELKQRGNYQIHVSPPVAAFRNLKFASRKSFFQWVQQNYSMQLVFQDRTGDQAVTCFWIHESGEILNSNYEPQFWRGKFVNTQTIRINKPIEMWMDKNSGTDTENDWKVMKGLFVKSVALNMSNPSNLGAHQF